MFCSNNNNNRTHILDVDSFGVFDATLHQRDTSAHLVIARLQNTAIAAATAAVAVTIEIAV